MELSDLSGQLTPERTAIVEKLMTRAWFQATDPQVQLELVLLPQEGRENHDGLLSHLASKPESAGGVTALYLDRLARGNFAVISVFRVRNQEGTEYFYESADWRYGPASGAKGIVFVENDGVLTHFIVLRGEKFATGQMEWDTIGGFMDVNVDGVTNVMQRIMVELQEELGLPDLRVKRIHDLGTFVVDAGFTCNRPTLFAAVIDGSEAARLSDTPVNPDQFELRAGPVVFPISQLLELVKTNTDSYYRNVVACILAHGIVDIRQLV